MKTQTRKMSDLDLTSPGREEVPRKGRAITQKEEKYFGRALALLDREKRMHPDFNISLEVDHEKGQAYFTYQKKNAEWEAIKKRIEEVDQMMKRSKGVKK